jgi:hypothetical protein
MDSDLTANETFPFSGTLRFHSNSRSSEGIKEYPRFQSKRCSQYLHQQAASIRLNFHFVLTRQHYSPSDLGVAPSPVLTLSKQ